jgi:hypothetical protein
MDKTKTSTVCQCDSCQSNCQCKKCDGSGFVFYGPAIICDVCYGKKCMYCQERGITRMPYDLCPQCHGVGQLKK